MKTFYSLTMKLFDYFETVILRRLNLFYVLLRVTIKTTEFAFIEFLRFYTSVTNGDLVQFAFIVLATS